MKKTLLVTIILLTSSSVVATNVEIPEDIDLVAGGSAFPINVTHSGKEIKIFFSSQSSPGIQVEYSPNPLVTKTDAQVTMYVNTSMSFVPGEYFIITDYECKTKEDKGSKKGGTYFSGTYKEEEPEEPEGEEPKEEEEPEKEEREIPVITAKIKESGILPSQLAILSLVVIFLISIALLWRKKRNENKK